MSVSISAVMAWALVTLYRQVAVGATTMCQLPWSNEYHSRASWKRPRVVFVALFVVDTHSPFMNLSTSSFTPGSTSWFGPAVQNVWAFTPLHRVFHAPRAEQVPLVYWKSPRARKLSSEPSFRPAV